MLQSDPAHSDPAQLDPVSQQTSTWDTGLQWYGKSGSVLLEPVFAKEPVFA